MAPGATKGDEKSLGSIKPRGTERMKRGDTVKEKEKRNVRKKEKAAL